MPLYRKLELDSTETLTITDEKREEVVNLLASFFGINRGVACLIARRIWTILRKEKGLTKGEVLEQNAMLRRVFRGCRIIQKLMEHDHAQW